MRNVWTITKKELKTFLYSPIAYILTAFFLLVSGFSSTTSWPGPTTRPCAPCSRATAWSA